MHLHQDELLPPFQNYCHSKNLVESKFFKFDQSYRKNYNYLCQINIK
jgi:hypothetical protein